MEASTNGDELRNIVVRALSVESVVIVLSIEITSRIGIQGIWEERRGLKHPYVS